MPAQALVAAMGSLVRACAFLVVARSAAREGSQAPVLGSHSLSHWTTMQVPTYRNLINITQYSLVEKAMAPHSSTLAWKIPWTEEPGGLQSRGLLRSRTRLSDFTITFHFHALEKEMATHSSVLAWRIPGTGEPGGLPSMGSHRVGHD